MLPTALGTLLLLGSVTVAAAQQPPIEVPETNVLIAPSDVLTYGGWLFFPEITTYAIGTDNLFQTTTDPIKVGAVGYIPKLLAEWTNGIHTTTLYGSLNQRFYPSRSDLDMFDRNGGAIQQYSPLPDLIFKLQGDYTHTTYNGVVSSIPTALASPKTPQPGPQPNPVVTVQSANVFINPTDTWSAAASAQKLFNHGMINLMGTLAQTTYTDQTAQTLAGSPNYSQQTFAGNGATWLGPLLYLFSDGVYSAHNAAPINTTPADNSIAYRARGGIGTRQEALFSAAAYFGYQGSNDDSAGRAGGEIYGGRLIYNPTAQLSITAAVDETINRASAGVAASNLALSLPTPSAAVVFLGSSTKITAPTLGVAYHITDQWSTFGTFGLTHIEFTGSSQLENAWLADVMLRYDMSRYWTFSWEYQYTAIKSNVPLSSSTRNYVYTAATYKF